MTQPYERDTQFSPEAWNRIQETKLVLASREIVRHLKDIRKGNPFLPSRGRPDIDFATIATGGEEVGALDLYACGVWGKLDSDGVILQLGRVDSTEPDFLLRFYTPMKDDNLVKLVIQLAPVSLDVLADETRPEEERERLYHKHVDPILQDYIAEHRERLLGELVRDTDAALRRLIEK